MSGWVVFGVFLFAWVGVAAWSRRRHASKIISIGGGFIGGCVASIVTAGALWGLTSAVTTAQAPEVRVWSDQREWCVELHADGIINTNFYPGKHDTSKFVMKGLDVMIPVQFGFETKEMPMFHLSADGSSMYVAADNTHPLQKVNIAACPE